MTQIFSTKDKIFELSFLDLNKNKIELTFLDKPNSQKTISVKKINFKAQNIRIHLTDKNNKTYILSYARILKITNNGILVWETKIKREDIILL